MLNDNYPKVLYKFLDAEGGYSMIENEELWFTKVEHLNDPYDCFHTQKMQGSYKLFSVDLDINNFFKSMNVGVCSLTEDPYNFLMWSYYNKHTGICVGLNMDVIQDKLIGYHVNDKNILH